MLYTQAMKGLPLEESGLVEPQLRRRLRALGVMTVEELLSQIRVAPDAMHRFLGIDLAQLQADSAGKALMTVRKVEDRFSERWFALGAVPPPGTEVEEQASEKRFLEMLEELKQKGEEKGKRADLLACFGPVRDQGQRGTCVGQAGAAVMECLHHAKYAEPASFSPQFLFYNSKMSDGEPDEDGTSSSVAMPTLETLGICEEAEWPYEPDIRIADVHHGPPPGAAVANALGHRSAETEELEPRDSYALKRVIDGGRPVTISVPVYQNWWGATTKLTGKIPMPLPYSQLDGGHAMCVAGYDYDDDFPGGGFFILRNSWGEEWAPESPIMAGYGAMAFEYVDRYGWEAFTARLS